MSLNNTRGRKAFYLWGDFQKSITEILRDPNVQSYVKGGSYASKREKLRKLLRDRKTNPEGVREHATRNPTTPLQIQDTRYGSQPRRANLPKKDARGRVLFGPEPAPRPTIARGAITINGEDLQLDWLLIGILSFAGFYNLRRG